MMDDVSRSDYFERIKELQDFIILQPSGITEFDETLVKHLLSKVTVLEGKLVFEFKSGVHNIYYPKYCFGTFSEITQ